MDTKHNTIREGRAENINPDEVGKEHRAKDLQAQEKVDIKESELGRETSQMPADEHIEPRMSQIDEGTKQLQNQSDDDKDLGKPMESDSDASEGRDDAGYTDDSAETDWKTDEK